MPGLNPSSLIYGVPMYRNFLLAEGARFAGLADRIGQGIDIVYRTVLSGGFDFPFFQSSNNAFEVDIPLDRSEVFKEFVRGRSASLGQLDELIVLRFLWAKSGSDFKALASALQRGQEIARKIVQSMQSKGMIEIEGSFFSLSRTLRRDIESVFQVDQMLLDL